MKPLLFCLLSLMLSIPALAQDLSLRNLLKFRQMELAKVDRKLSGKGWKFMSDSKPADGFMGKAVWAYNPNPKGDGAPAWCILYYNDTSPSRILYNVYVGNSVQKIHKKIRRRKMLPVAEGSNLDGVEQLEYYADYSDDKHVLRLMKYEQYGYSGIKIFDKSDYEKAKDNGRL